MRETGLRTACLERHLARTVNATVRRASRGERNLVNAISGTTATEDRQALAQLMTLVVAA